MYGLSKRSAPRAQGSRKTMIERHAVEYGSADGLPLHLDMLAPEPRESRRMPAVVYVHGGGWAGGERVWTPNRILAEAGFFTVSISCRFSQQAIFPAQVHDVKAAIRWVRANADRFGVDPARVGIWGHSAGGHLAALAAVTEGVPELEGGSGNPGYDSSVQAAIPISAPLDFLVDWYAVQRIPVGQDTAGVVTQLFGGLPEHRRDLARLASPLWHAGPASPPHLLIHGELDDVVPVGQARAYTSALRRLGQPRAELIELPSVGHMADTALYPGEPDPHRLKMRVVEFFTANLGR
jgi:acetyl esterase/lipase